MAGNVNNKFLINAPAGSGKTTYIRTQLKKICLLEPQCNILCITYTNRAADELKKNLDNSNVVVSTIHFYINDLISPFFSLPETIDLYWEIFGNSIEQRIRNERNDANIEISNNNYKEKNGELSVSFIKANLLKLSYGETPFTSLYTGKLSHDDMIMFANRLVKKFPVILKKIGDKFNYIFIDEYQDTSADILDIFYEAVKDRETVKLYLLGDKMQQIYRNYDGTFEKKLQDFDTTIRLSVNYRSIGKIISILNKIYNDSSFEQTATDINMGIISDVDPKIIISSDVKQTVSKLQFEFPKILTLYLMNKSKYDEIGAGKLFEAYRMMETYSFGKKYSPQDVLSDLSNDNPDDLMKFLFLFNKIMEFYSNENFGLLISTCNKEFKYFSSNSFQIHKHGDKKLLKEKFEKIKNIYYSKECFIKEVFNSLLENGLIQALLLDKFTENTEYQSVFDIEVLEVIKLATYLNLPNISTQHGVKGESHSSVVFVADDNKNTPNVRMYPFFKLWSTLDFSLPEFESLFYSYIEKIKDVENRLGMKISELTAKTHNENEKNKNLLISSSQQVLDYYKENILFETLCSKDFKKYLEKTNVGNAKKIFKISEIEGILTAYKLFYVGCSRARKNLIIVVDETKIREFEDYFINKVKSIGFTVYSE